MTKEEAINEIKSWDFLEGKEIEAIHTLVPELAEDEDERVRKSLIEFLTIIKGISENGRTTWTVRKGDAEMCKSSIAYLEKQKENIEKEYVFRPLAGTDITIAAEQAIRRADEGDRLVLAFNGAYIPVRKGCNANKIVDIYDAFIEKQKDASKAIEAVDRIDKYIDEHLANAHDMKDSNPDKKYYRGWDDALGEMARILQDVYSGEKQKEQNGKDEECTDFTIYYPLKNGKGEYECIPYSFNDSLTFFSEDKDLIDFHRACFYTEEECNEWIEQQKEQKSVDYDHEMWKNCEVNFEGGKKEVIEHPEKYGLQKPAEWNGEDKEMLDSIIRVVCGVGVQPNGLREKQVSWLKALRPQSKDEIYKEKDEAFKLGKHQLAIKFMNYLDENRPEGKMSLSNGECEDIDKAFKENDWPKIMRYVEKYSPQLKPEWSEEDEDMLNSCISSIEEAKENRYAYKETDGDTSYDHEIDWLKSLRPQYHGDVTMTEAYKMGLEAGKASSWKPSEKQTNNVIVELTRVELGDIINGLYYLKEKYYEDCKEHNGTATVDLSDEFKFYFKRFNEVLDLYTRLHELEKQTYETATTVKYYE